MQVRGPPAAFLRVFGHEPGLDSAAVLQPSCSRPGGVAVKWWQESDD